jgi:hypothetical protein
MTIKFRPYFPFRRDNRRPDGLWDAPDTTDDNIKGTSVDPYEPVWPRWKQAPPLHGEGDFVSDQPYFDIDEIRQAAEFYPPGRPLVDMNVGGNPASRQRVADMPGGNFFRRRLLVQPDDPPQMDSGLHSTGASDAELVPIGLAPGGSSSSPSFAGFIPGRARPGEAQSAVEPLNADLRARKRKDAIAAGEGGSFSVGPNPNANPNAPWYEHLARSNVRDYAQQIEQVAEEEGIDPNLIRAIMFVETTHGNYGGGGRIADALGISKSVLPMNINEQYWGDTFGARAELDKPLYNIRGGARMLKNIIGNFQSLTPIEAIATLYNDSNATRVSDYGARVKSVYNTRPWERETAPINAAPISRLRFK